MSNTSTMPQMTQANAPGSKVPSPVSMSRPGDVFSQSAGDLASAGNVYQQQINGTSPGSQLLGMAGAGAVNAGSPNSPGSALLGQAANSASNMSGSTGPGMGHLTGGASTYGTVNAGISREQKAQAGAANQFGYLGGRAASGADMLSSSANRLRDLGSANTMRNTMAGYANPYQGEVIDRGVNQIMDQRDIALNNVGGQAAQMNAFGGSRQGIIEGQIYSDANRDAGDLAATMGRQGFLDQGSLAQADISARQNALNSSGGLGANLMGQGMQALGQDAAINAGLTQQRLAGAQGKLNVADMLNQRGNQAIQTQAGLAGQLNNQQLAAINAQAGIAGQAFNQQNTGAQNAQQLGGQLFGMGSNINQDQMRAGMIQQGMNQQTLDASRNQFDAYTQRPQDMLNVIMSGVTGSPLQGNSTQTQTYKPGLFDYLSLGSQMGSSYLGGK